MGFLTIFLLLVIIFLFKIGKVPIFSPAGIFTWVWLLFCCFSVIILSNEYTFHYGGILWIMVAILLVLIAHLLIFSKGIRYQREKSEDSIYIPWRIVTIFLVLSWLSVIVTMVKTGIHLETLFDFSKLLDSTHEQALQHYSGETTSSLFNQILGTFLYTTPLCCGYALPYAEASKQRIACFSSFLPTILAMILASTKLAFVTGIILFFLGYYVSYTCKTRSKIRIPLKYWLILGGGVLAFFGLIFLSFVLRIGESGEQIHRIIINKIGVYAVGHVQGFDAWFSRNEHDTAGLGIYTFRAISSKLGILTKEQGVYSIEPGSCTNVYTPFRDLIQDFGVFGSLLCLFWVGVLCSICLQRILSQGVRTRIEQFILVVLMFGILYFISPWVYTTYFFVFFVFALFLMACKPKHQPTALNWKR